MKILLKYILIALFCISTIKNDCTGTAVTESACTTDSTCKWTQTVPAGCSGGNAACSAPASSEACLAANNACSWDAATGCSGGNAACLAPATSEACTTANGACSWAEAATGTCTAKTCADYTGQTACNAVTTCEWSNNACSTKSAVETSCDDYTDETDCNAVTTCEWSNDECTTKSSTTTTTTTTNTDGVFGLKSSILIFLISFLF